MINAAIPDLQRAIAYAESIGVEVPDANGRALRRIAMIGQRESIRNAPISPDQQTLNKVLRARSEARKARNADKFAGDIAARMLAAKRAKGPVDAGTVAKINLRAAKQAKTRANRVERGIKKGAKARRNPRSTSRPMPGGLVRSISQHSTNEYAEIFCAANSEAGKYAFRIHSEKGLTWNKRGPGTVAKGGRADAWFILRALEDNAQDFYRIFDDEHRKAAP